MLKAVIFDFDGVIADSEPLHFSAFKETLSRYDVELTQKRYYNEYLGYTDNECAKAISADFDLGLDKAGIDRLVQAKTALFDNLVRAESTIIDGVCEFVDRIKGRGIRLAVCSGALLGDIELMLAGTDLTDTFEIIVAADHVQRGKPDPEGLLLVLQRLNETGPGDILPKDCVVIEDSRWGLEAASAARMHTIAVANTYPYEELKPLAEKTVERLDKLTLTDLQSICSN
ncbi:MAG TPA: HAD family phosphatase [Planctomycetes bacterium]|nr:HAD family phosphatase [Planctomycetota bacterium]HIJ69807.1 HAD family phosphatase [Planctomycetota bacterium]